MGYTHYWNFNPTEKSEEQFEKVLDDCKKILKGRDDIIICGGDGTGNPIITKDAIWLNGDGRLDLDHETFYFSPKEDTGFDFCKTARKPYDLIVGAILISLFNRMSGFTFSSDGNVNDWKPIFEYYNNVGLKLSKAKKEKILKNL